MARARLNPQPNVQMERPQFHGSINQVSLVAQLDGRGRGGGSGCGSGRVAGVLACNWLAARRGLFEEFVRLIIVQFK